MKTIRHKYNLRWFGAIAIAPRYFKIGETIYFIHIEKMCEYVDVYFSFGAYKDNYYNIHFHSKLKLYSNTKGLYFNFCYWINNKKKKKIRIYICD